MAGVYCVNAMLTLTESDQAAVVMDSSEHLVRLHQQSSSVATTVAHPSQTTFPLMLKKNTKLKQQKKIYNSLLAVFFQNANNATKTTKL